MDELKTQLLKARLQAIISTVENAGNITKPISLTLAKDFNNILNDFCNAFPEHKDSFPEKIPYKLGRNVSEANSSFLDLRTKAEQVVKVVEVLSTDG